MGRESQKGKKESGLNRENKGRGNKKRGKNVEKGFKKGRKAGHGIFRSSTDLVKGNLIPKGRTRQGISSDGENLFRGSRDEFFAQREKGGKFLEREGISPFVPSLIGSLEKK
jgi:hypothetical protein